MRTILIKSQLQSYRLVSYALHYAEVEKLGLKWSTLRSHFFAHFCNKGAKFLTEMSELPKNLKKVKKLKIEKDVRQKKTKNLLLIVAKVNLGVKKFVSPNAKIFVLCIFLANMSKWQKMHSKSEK